MLLRAARRTFAMPPLARAAAALAARDALRPLGILRSSKGGLRPRLRLELGVSMMSTTGRDGSTAAEGADRSEDVAAGTGDEEAGADEDKSEAVDSEAPPDVDSLRTEVTELKEARLRALAELENVRRIAERDVSNAKTYAIQKFAKQLLSVSDNLERALEAAGATDEGAAAQAEQGADASKLELLVNGVRATKQELVKVLELNGITSFGESGDKYDPQSMEAMFVMPVSQELPPSTVGQVLLRGYRFKDRILRPAQVGATPVQ